ncbi:MAG: cation transporter [Oscillospiraceae bacterium]|nr:cation transporter [Oscillospiraceae bacterium]
MFGFTKKEIIEKTMHIEGMHCGHCKANVEKALNAISGVSAEVDLEKKVAAVKLVKNVVVDKIKEAVEDIGLEVVAIDG